MTDLISSVGASEASAGNELAEPKTNSFEEMANSFLKSGEDIQADIDHRRDMALSETDPAKKQMYMNTHNEAVNALTIQFQLNFLRVGAELMKLPGILKNG
jgi:hypothetical protein